jgi:hypothetical protein
MIMAWHGCDASRPATTLACSPEAVWLWPGIPLTHRRGGMILPRSPDTIRGLAAKLHGPDAVHSAVVQTVEYAASLLNQGDLARAERSLSRAGLPPVTPDGYLLMRRVADRLGMPLPALPVGQSPRLWSATDIDHFARLHVAQTVWHGAAIAKAGFDPDEPRDGHGRWTADGDAGGKAPWLPVGRAQIDPAVYYPGGRVGPRITEASTVVPADPLRSGPALVAGTATVLSGTSALLRNPVALNAAIATGEVVLETVAEAAAAVTPAGWVALGLIGLGATAYWVYQRVQNDNRSAEPAGPQIHPGPPATAQNLPPPPGYPAQPPTLPPPPVYPTTPPHLPTHSGNPAQVNTPKAETYPSQGPHLPNAVQSRSNPPSPNGRKGNDEHQDGVAKAEAELEAKYGKNPSVLIRRECRVKTPSGARTSRFIDVCAQDRVTGAILEGVQVGRETKAQNPVAREQKAIEDIRTASPGTNLRFNPYNRR